jgi:hypothetical protein
MHTIRIDGTAVTFLSYADAVRKLVGFWERGYEMDQLYRVTGAVFGHSWRAVQDDVLDALNA